MSGGGNHLGFLIHIKNPVCKFVPMIMIYSFGSIKFAVYEGNYLTTCSGVRGHLRFSIGIKNIHEYEAIFNRPGLTLEGDSGEEVALWLLTSLCTSAKREVAL